MTGKKQFKVQWICKAVPGSQRKKSKGQKQPAAAGEPGKPGCQLQSLSATA